MLSNGFCHMIFILLKLFWAVICFIDKNIHYGYELTVNQIDVWEMSRLTKSKNIADMWKLSRLMKEFDILWEIWLINNTVDVWLWVMPRVIENCCMTLFNWEQLICKNYLMLNDIREISWLRTQLMLRVVWLIKKIWQIMRYQG